jgi:hypothetical protein
LLFASTISWSILLSPKENDVWVGACGSLAVFEHTSASPIRACCIVSNIPEDVASNFSSHWFFGTPRTFVFFIVQAFNLGQPPE